MLLLSLLPYTVTIIIIFVISVIGIVGEEKLGKIGNKVITVVESELFRFFGTS